MLAALQILGGVLAWVTFCVAFGFAGAVFAVYMGLLQ